MRTGCGDRRGKPFPVDLSDVHVLIVDDNEDALDIFSTALGRSGANVLKARSGRDALTILTAVRVDVLVSDLAMPGEDGLWLIQQVRRLKSEHGGSIPALAVSAHQDDFTVEQVTAAGFQAFLSKPVDPFDLCRTVAFLVGRSQGTI